MYEAKVTHGAIEVRDAPQNYAILGGPVVELTLSHGYKERRCTLKLILLIYGGTKPNIEVSGWLNYIKINFTQIVVKKIIKAMSK